MKYLLIGVAVLLIIAISVGATLLFRGDASRGPIGTPDSPSDPSIASSDDTGPVSIITSDPTCEPWRPINDTLVSIERKGWAERDYSIPATSWSPEQRATYEEIASAMRQSADQMATLVKLTPHRIMRELYEQTIAYRRAYADRIPSYTVADNSLVVTASNTAGAITAICASIGNNSAAARSPLVPNLSDPAKTLRPANSERPEIFMPAPPNSVCSRWTQAMKSFEDGTATWRQIDNSLPASAWTAEQRAIIEAAGSQMTEFANAISEMAADSDNRIIEDLGALSVQYFRAYVAAIPTYSKADSFLSSTALYGSLTVFNACAAANAG